jgi:tetratricopeptide (TPR) repeat protein
VWFLILLTIVDSGGSQDSPADRAYSALRERDYERAVSLLREAVASSPDRIGIRKDLGYTLLKIGETEAARDVFASALQLAPDDDHLAREYAFLAYETKQKAVARRTFDRLRRKGDEVAERAFQNIDAPLAEGISRWKRAVELAPGRFSAHEELARLAEERDEFDLAALHHFAAWRLRPDRRSSLLALGRVWKSMGRHEQAHAALLAASRGTESRVAEAARELLPERYPWVYEFVAALELDPANVALRRELAWLHLEMGQKVEAEAQFRSVIASEPSDAWSLAQLGFLLLARNKADEALPMLDRALKTEDDELQDRIRAALNIPQQLRKRSDVPRSQTSVEAIDMARRSLEAGYLRDAVRYLRIAHQNDPLDFSVMLDLGRTWNVLRDDRQASQWFALARRSPDTSVAKEASQAYRNLSPQFARFRTTAWMYPMYSSRWRDLFSYAQWQTELMPAWPVRPYFTTRFAGDLRQVESRGPTPAYLSESAVIVGIGLTARPWHGVRAWVEAGYSASYADQPGEERFRPDLRGGLAWSRIIGRGRGRRGLFSQISADLVYLSRFDNDALAYVLNRSGYTVVRTERGGVQLCWNLNVTADARRYYWANVAETGPGVRITLKPVVLTLDALRGRYTSPDGSRPPRYSDLRIGLWYAFTR